MQVSEDENMTRALRNRRSARPGSWVKSSLSFPNGKCVEVADLAGGGTGVRDSKDVRGPVLKFTPDEWRAFLDDVRDRAYSKSMKIQRT